MPNALKVIPSGLIAGRKHCVLCKRWRPQSDFKAAKWLLKHDRDRAYAGELTDLCAYCHEQERRRKMGQTKSKNAKEFWDNIEYPSALRCKKCKKMRPPDEMAPRVRVLVDGSRRRYLASICRHCEAERQRVYRAKLPTEEVTERNRRYARTYKKRIGAKKWREQKREAYARQVEVKEGRIVKHKKPPEQGRELVPIEPFQEWLLERSRFHGRSSGQDHFVSKGQIGIKNLAQIVGLSERTINRFISGRELDKHGRERILDKIPLNTVDQCLTKEGTNSLWELYPELYD